MKDCGFFGNFKSISSGVKGFFGSGKGRETVTGGEATVNLIPFEILSAR